LPAYRAFSSFIATEYAPYGRTTLAVTSLLGGEQRYRNDIRSRTTVSNLTPDQIHQIGLREIDRIQAIMLSIAQQQGFTDLASFRESLKTNPKYIAQMQPKLPELFGFIPGSPVTVEAIAYHEGIPGHHMQLSVAQQLAALPKFRQHGGNSGYVEGWALYAEQLGKEVGFYQDPVSDYERLSSELFRAVRLVVDTGIHSQGWTRDQVVDFLRNSGAIDEPTIQSETDRYIAWPAQALACKLGQLKFRELRDRAQQELGPKFDIRSFHDQMLSGGVLPLDLLDSRTESWIRAQKSGLISAAAH
jgi:uncharacterized protein (DUF885 family)